MSDRRKFLKTIGGAIAAGGAVVASRRPGVMTAQGPRTCTAFPLPSAPPSPAMFPYVDRLPIPRVLRPIGTAPNPHGRDRLSPYFEVSMTQVAQKLHRDLPPTQVWTYEGTYPGPSFDVRRGQPIAVKWINNLPQRHLFADSLDRTLHGADRGEPDVRTVVHLHGGKTMPESDGHPEAWFTPGFAQTGPFPNSGIYYYTNDQPSAMLWYHDHALAITRLNVVAGLAGCYFIREPDEESIGLPTGEYEVPLVIQDKRFNRDGSIFYPTISLPPFVLPVWQPDYSGDVALVNGMVMPYLEVEPRRYRFRILNAANSTFFNLRLQAGSNPGPDFVQIGADVGFLPRPVRVQTLLMSNAERVDVIVDFSEFDGADVEMTNDAATPFPVGFRPAISRVMQFRVRRRSGSRDQSRIPSQLPAPPSIDTGSGMPPTRDIVMTEETVMLRVPEGFCDVHLPTRLLVEEGSFHDPVTTALVAGRTEIWRFINATAVAHPMHVHLAEMRVLDRQMFNVDRYNQTGEIVTLSARQAAAPTELNAPKDTVRVDFRTMTRVLVHFDVPKDIPLASGQRLRYVHHCHMLEHEDNDMMRPFDVVIP